jgi:murein L,D-transpeptidase YcbB/YkuD
VEAAFQAREAFAPTSRAALLEEIDDDDPAGSAAALLPAQPEFWALAEAYRRHSEIALAGGWGKVPEGPKLELNTRDERVRALRARLAETDGATLAVAEPDLFDADLELAAKRFQRRHGLGDDGVVGFRTIDALNIPVEDRLRAIAFNLQKLFHKRRDWGDRYIYVNIAGAELTYVDRGAVRAHVRTVVGRTDRQTPELDSEINRLEFNPYWTVPPKIARVDLLPKVQSNPAYFAEHNIRVYTSWSEDANEIDPTTIDWFSPEAKAMRYRLKQDPGPENALGPVKLLFPNQYDVYIHGTTHQELFVKPARFFSSGCIRVKEPLDLAALVLNDDPSWTRERIDATVAHGRNTSVMLQRPLPVHLDYRTVWADAEGLLQIRDDIYRRDKLPAKPVVAQSAAAMR